MKKDSACSSGCQYAEDVGMEEYSCQKECQYALASRGILPLSQAPRDGTYVALYTKHGGHKHYMRWDTSYSIHGLGGNWTDGTANMSDLDYLGWKETPEMSSKQLQNIEDTLSAEELQLIAKDNEILELKSSLKRHIGAFNEIHRICNADTGKEFPREVERVIAINAIALGILGETHESTAATPQPALTGGTEA